MPAHVANLEVTPADILMPEPGLSQQIIATAHYADGSTRDVTREASYINTPSVAEVSQDGLLSSQRKGEAALLVRYEGSFVTLPTTILTNKPGFQWVQLPSYNYIDDAIDHKLRKLRILPSQLSSDAEFLRRASLDLTGLPPKPMEVDAFLKDKTPQREKRARLIDKMLGSPEYVDHWSLKWGDLLESNRNFFGAQRHVAL